MDNAAPTTPAIPPDSARDTAPPPPPIPPPMTPARAADTLDNLSAMIDRIERAADTGELTTVNLYRVNASGREPVANIPGDQFDPFTIGARYGSGRYFARLKVNNQWAGSATFPAQAAAGAPTPPIGAAPAPAPADTITTAQLFTALLTMMQSAQQQSTALLTAMVQRQGQDGLKAADVLGLVKNRSEVGELVSGLRELHAMAPTGGGGESSDLAAIASMVAPLIAAAQRPPHAAPQRRLPTAPPRPGASARTPPPRIGRPLVPIVVPPGPPPGTPNGTTQPAPAPQPREPAGLDDLSAHMLAVLSRERDAGTEPRRVALRLASLIDQAGDAGAIVAQSLLDSTEAEYAARLAELAPRWAGQADRAWAVAVADDLSAIIEPWFGGPDEDQDDDQDDDDQDQDQHAAAESIKAPAPWEGGGA